MPKAAEQSSTSRQHGLRHAEQRQQLIVPTAVMNVEQQRARSVGRIGGVDFAAGEPPQQIRVDRPEGEFAARGEIADARASFCNSQASLVPEK